MTRDVEIVDAEVLDFAPITSRPEADQIARDLTRLVLCADDALADAMMLISRAWYGQVWVAAGYQSWEEWGRVALADLQRELATRRRVAALVSVAYIDAEKRFPMPTIPVVAALFGLKSDSLRKELRKTTKPPAPVARRPKPKEAIRHITINAILRQAAHDNLHIGQVQLAELLGVSQSTINGDLKTLEASGWQPPTLAEVLHHATEPPEPTVSVPQCNTNKVSAAASSTDNKAQSALVARIETTIPHLVEAANQLQAALSDSDHGADADSIKQACLTAAEPAAKALRDLNLLLATLQNALDTAAPLPAPSSEIERRDAAAKAINNQNSAAFQPLFLAPHANQLNVSVGQK